MRAGQSRLKWWLNARFVVIVEVVGYTLSAIVGVGAIYSVFTRVEVLAQANGTVNPVFVTVAADKESVVLEFLVSDGQEVASGQPVCRIVTDPQDQLRAVAERQITAAVSTLEENEHAGAAVTAAKVKAALKDLPPIRAAETLTSPADGMAKLLVDPAANKAVPAGTPLAALYDMGTLVAECELELTNADKVADGQVARVTLPELSEPVVGKVVSALSETTVSLRFEDVGPDVRKVFADQLLEVATPGFTVRARIVVGHQSLFVNLLGRKST